MSLIDLPRLGMTNPDTVSRVWWTRGIWKRAGWYRDREGKLRPYSKPWKRKGKWHRPNSWWDETRYFLKADVRIKFTGKEYVTELDCASDAEAERLCNEIIRLCNRAKDFVVPERIVAAAILRMDRDRAAAATNNTDTVPYRAMIYTQPAPARHHHILHSMPSSHIDGGTVGEHAQGFITSTGRFVDRKEAMTIAFLSGQVKPETIMRKVPDLFSEDLW